MVKIDKKARIALKYSLILTFSVLTIFLAYFVLASHIITTSSGVTTYNVLEDVPYTYNITVNNTDPGQTENITQVNMTLSGTGFTFIPSTQGNSFANLSFLNTSNTLSWSNFTHMIINGSEFKHFWFNATISTPGAYNITVITLNVTGQFNSNISITVNDTTMPNLVQIAQPLNQTYSSNTTIPLNFTILDNGVVSSCWYSLDGGVTNTTIASCANTTINTSAVANIILLLWANDTYNNINLSTLSFNINQRAFSSGQNLVYINRTQNTLLNFSITSESGASASNITLVNITIPQGASYIANSNLTTSSEKAIGNSSGNIWFNTSLAGFRWGASNDFIINVTAPVMTGTAQFIVLVTKVNAETNTTTHSFVANFDFSGYVRNETGGNASNVNVSIYQYVQGQNGPPTEILVASTNSSADGSFNLRSINGSANTYKVKLVLYNSSNAATKIGSTLPPFPAMMYYPLPFSGEFEFMKPPALNGTTFYLQPAATLRLGATNTTTAQKFGYEVIDQVVGFPVESNIMNAVTSVDVIVPTGRNYTIMFTRIPFGQNAFAFVPTLCSGNFMNDTTCPTPPISNSTLGTLSEGQILNVNQSLNFAPYRLTGCINISNAATTLAVTSFNITNIKTKLVPWAGFVPPMDADMGDINVSTDIIKNFTINNGQIQACNNTLAFFNISIIGSSVGINYLLEFYAKNETLESSAGGEYLAGFQNITITNNTNYNITLYKPTGAYWSSGLGSTNSSKMRINIQNSTGGEITTGMHIDVKIKHQVTGTLHYIVETLVNGTFYLPILNNSNWAKINVFANDAPPKELTLNLSRAENNITLVTMSDGRGAGFKRINSSGQPEMINTTFLNSSMPIQMRFLRYSSDCNVVNPPSACEITSMTAKEFNPFKALVAGRINMEMKIASSNVTITFFNFDMFAAKQPPMDTIMNDNASSSSSSNQVWQFGSFVPVNTYDYAVIETPYSNSQSSGSYFNDTWAFNTTMPILYDENWNAVWNFSRGDTSANLSDDFLDYNSSALYRNYLLSSGVSCDKTDTNLNVTPCYMNTSADKIYMKIPHFSGVSPSISGTAPAAGAATSSSGGGGGGGGGFWTATFILTDTQSKEGFSKELRAKERFSLKVSGSDHYVGIISLTSTTATINISSTPQQATFYIGDEKKFEVTDDNYYDLLVRLDSIANSKANLTIKAISEKMPETAATPETSGETAEAEEAEEAELTSAGKTKIIITIIILIIVIIIAVIVFIYYKKRRL